jgi:hypothetical protein
VEVTAIRGEIRAHALHRLHPFPALRTENSDGIRGLRGVTYRSVRVSATLDGEFASSDQVYLRTSLADYQRLRGRVRYQLLTNLAVSWTGSWLNNNNPNSKTVPLNLGDYDLRTIDNSLAILWAPKGGNRFRFSGEYARQNWRSDIRYLAPQMLSPERSLCREDAHARTFVADFVPATGKGLAPWFSAGGSVQAVHSSVHPEAVKPRSFSR